MNKSNGFSLIELLVSMVLLSSIIFIGSFAYSVFVQKWDGRLGQFEQSFLLSKNFVLIHRIISSVKPYVVESDENQPTLAFWGTTSSVMFISNSALFESKSPTLVRLDVVKENDSSYLLYQEKTLKQDFLRNFFKDISWTYTKRIELKAERIKFRYKGWESLDAKAKATLFETPSVGQDNINWFDSYSAQSRQLMPMIMGIDMTLRSGESNLLVIRLIDEAEMQISRFQDDI